MDFKSYFLDLFQYHDEANVRVMNILYPANPNLPEYAYRMFSHILMTQHVWQRRIQGGSFDYEFWSILEEAELHSLVSKNRAELEIVLSHYTGKQSIRYTALDGLKYECDVQSILSHVSHHYAYHRGQIAKVIRDSGLVPPGTDYILFRRLTL